MVVRSRRVLGAVTLMLQQPRLDTGEQLRRVKVFKERQQKPLKPREAGWIGASPRPTEGWFLPSDFSKQSWCGEKKTWSLRKDLKNLKLIEEREFKFRDERKRDSDLIGIRLRRDRAGAFKVLNFLRQHQELYNAYRYSKPISDAALRRTSVRGPPSDYRDAIGHYEEELVNSWTEHLKITPPFTNTHSGELEESAFLAGTAAGGTAEEYTASLKSQEAQIRALKRELDPRLGEFVKAFKNLSNEEFERLWHANPEYALTALRLQHHLAALLLNLKRHEADNLAMTAGGVPMNLMNELKALEKEVKRYAAMAAAFTQSKGGAVLGPVSRNPPGRSEDTQDQVPPSKITPESIELITRLLSSHLPGGAQ